MKGVHWHIVQATLTEVATMSPEKCGRANLHSGMDVVRKELVVGEGCFAGCLLRLCLNKAASDEIIWHCKPGTQTMSSLEDEWPVLTIRGTTLAGV